MGRWRHNGELKLSIYWDWFQKRILHVKFPFTIDFHLSINIGTWNTSLGPFWTSFGLMMSPRESKLQYSEKVISEKNFSSKFYQILILVFLSPMIHDIQLWDIFTQFGNNGVTKEINVQEFWKINERTGFDLLKKQMIESEEVSIVVWSRCITLKLFWRKLENDFIRRPRFHTFHQIFYKNVVILVFWNKYFPLVPIFIMVKT